MLLIGQRHCRRSALLEEALQRRGGRLRLIEWRELLARGELPADLAGEHHRWCKIDPPAEEAALTDRLIADGWRALGGEGPAPQPLRFGELAHGAAWFAGLTHWLTQIAAQLAVLAPGLRLFNPVDEILNMGDKWRCQQRLQAHAVSVPQLLGPLAGLTELEASWPVADHPRLFLKARYGSSAAGVVALQRHRDGRLSATSPTRLAADGALFNHLRPTTLRERPAVAALVDALAAQGAYVERWVTKPRTPGQRQASHDFRVVCFAGRARQRIARSSTAPMTNLHLGNRRATPHWLTGTELAALAATAEAAASAFPNSKVIGLDIIQRGGCGTVLEANAFGDLLPDLYYDGATTFDDQAAQVWADEG